MNETNEIKTEDILQEAVEQAQDEIVAVSAEITETAVAEEPAEAESPAPKKKLTVKDVIGIVSPAIIVYLLLRFVFALYIIPTGSMEPTIATNSLALNWRLPYLVSDKMPERGDIVSFYSDDVHEILIKRVVGVPGDVLSTQDGHLVRNGEVLDEPYAIGRTDFFGVEEYTVPEGCVFCMGDNREHSRDSRRFDDPFVSIHSLQAEYLFSFKLPF